MGGWCFEMHDRLFLELLRVNTRFCWIRDGYSSLVSGVGRLGLGIVLGLDCIQALLVRRGVGNMRIMRWDGIQQLLPVNTLLRP